MLHLGACTSAVMAAAAGGRLAVDVVAADMQRALAMAWRQSAQRRLAAISRSGWQAKGSPRPHPDGQSRWFSIPRPDKSSTGRRGYARLGPGAAVTPPRPRPTPSPPNPSLHRSLTQSPSFRLSATSRSARHLRPHARPFACAHTCPRLLSRSQHLSAVPSVACGWPRLVCSPMQS